MPLVSVLMPVYNRKDFLNMSISSVLKEDFRDFELLICDDGSSDGSIEVIKTFALKDNRIKYFRRDKNSGKPSIIYKFLADKALGKYIIASDSDDIAMPKRLSVLVKTAERHHSASVVYGKTKVVRRTKIIRSPFYYGRDFNQFDLYTANFVPDGAALIRKDFYDRIGGYNPEIIFGEDYDLRLRLAMEGPFIYVNELVYIYFLHKKSWTATSKITADEDKFRSAILETCQSHLAANNIISNFSYKSQTALSYLASAYYSQNNLQQNKSSRFLQVIKSVFNPKDVVKKDEFKQLLVQLGIRAKQYIVVHASLSSFISLEGGANTIIESLKELITEEGLIIMPAFTYDTTYGSIKPHKVKKKKCFHLKLPVSKPIGIVAETFRRSENVFRNFHPQFSFSFWGKEAASLSQKYYMSDSLSENSPLGEILLNDGYVLMLGTGFETVSILHTAEYLAKIPYAEYKAYYAYQKDSDLCVVELRTTGHSEEFRKIAGLLSFNKINYTSIKIGKATCHLIKARDLVHWAVELLKREPDFFLCNKESCLSCKDRKAFIKKAVNKST